MLLLVPGKILNRIILEKLKMALNSTQRDHQAGSHPESSCTDQIATLCIIIVQSIEWNSRVYINMIDFEKAFEILDCETIWKLMRHYGDYQVHLDNQNDIQRNDLQSSIQRKDH